MFRTDFFNKRIYRHGEEISIIKSLHKSQAVVESARPASISSANRGSLKGANVWSRKTPGYVERTENQPFLGSEEPLCAPIIIESLCPQPCFPLSLLHCAAYLGNPVEVLPPIYASSWIGKQEWLLDLCSKRQVTLNIDKNRSTGNSSI